MLRIGALLIACSLVLWMALRLFTRRAGRRIHAPSCRRCLYNLTGLQSRVCPECGNELDASGILKPNQLVPLNRLTRVSIWTAIIAGLAVFVVPLTDARLPAPRVFTFQLSLGPPRSGAYERLVVAGSQQARGEALGEIRRARLTVTHDDGPPAVLSLNLAGNSAKSIAPAHRGRGWSLRDEAAATAGLREWFDLIGLQGDRSLVNEETAALAQLLLYGEHLSNDRRAMFRWGEVISGFRFRDSLGSITVTRATAVAPDPWRKAILIGPWAGLWLAVGLPLAWWPKSPRGRGATTLGLGVSHR